MRIIDRRLWSKALSAVVVAALVLLLPALGWSGEDAGSIDQVGNGIKALVNLIKGPVYGICILAATVICAIKLLNRQYGYILVWFLSVAFLAIAFDVLLDGSAGSNNGPLIVVSGPSIDPEKSALSFMVCKSLNGIGYYVNVGLMFSSAIIQKVVAWQIPLVIASFGALGAYRKMHRGDYFAPVSWMLTAGVLLSFAVFPTAKVRVDVPGGEDDKSSLVKIMSKDAMWSTDPNSGYPMPPVAAWGLSIGMSVMKVAAEMAPAKATPATTKESEAERLAAAVDEAVKSARLPDSVVSLLRGYTANAWMSIAHRFSQSTTGTQSGFTNDDRRSLAKNGLSPIGKWFFHDGKNYHGMSYDWGLFNEETDIPGGDEVGINDKNIATDKGGGLTFQDLSRLHLTTPTADQSSEFFQHDPVKKLFKPDDVALFKQYRNELNTISDNFRTAFSSELDRFSVSKSSDYWFYSFGMNWDVYSYGGKKRFGGNGDGINLLYLAEDGYASLGRLASKQMVANGLVEDRELAWRWWGWWWTGVESWGRWYGWWNWDAAVESTEPSWHHAAAMYGFNASMLSSDYYWTRSSGLPFDGLPYRALADIGYFTLIAQSMPWGSSPSYNVKIRYRTIGGASATTDRDALYEQQLKKFFSDTIDNINDERQKKYAQLCSIRILANKFMAQCQSDWEKAKAAGNVSGENPYTGRFANVFDPGRASVSVTFEPVSFINDVVTRAVEYYTVENAGKCSDVLNGNKWTDPDAYGCMLFAGIGNGNGNNGEESGLDADTLSMLEDMGIDFDGESNSAEIGNDHISKRSDYLGPILSYRGTSRAVKNTKDVLDAHYSSGGDNLIDSDSVSVPGSKELARLVSVPRLAKQLGWPSDGMTAKSAVFDAGASAYTDLPTMLPKPSGAELSIWSMSLGDIIEYIIQWIISAIAYVGLLCIWALARLAAIILPLAAPHAIGLSLMLAVIAYPSFMIGAMVRWESMLEWGRVILWICLWVLPLSIGFRILNGAWRAGSPHVSMLDPAVLITQVGAVWLIMASPSIAMAIVAPSFSSFSSLGEKIWGLGQKIAMLSFAAGAAVAAAPIGAAVGAAGAAGAAKGGGTAAASAGSGAAGGGTASVSGGSAATATRGAAAQGAAGAQGGGGATATGGRGLGGGPSAPSSSPSGGIGGGSTGGSGGTTRGAPSAGGNSAGTASGQSRGSTQSTARRSGNTRLDSASEKGTGNTRLDSAGDEGGSEENGDGSETSSGGNSAGGASGGGGSFGGASKSGIRAAGSGMSAARRRLNAIKSSPIIRGAVSASAKTMEHMGKFAELTDVFGTGHSEMASRFGSRAETAVRKMEAKKDAQTAAQKSQEAEDQRNQNLSKAIADGIRGGMGGGSEPTDAAAPSPLGDQ